MAEALGVTRGAVSQWVSRARDGGAEALRRREPPGGVQTERGATGPASRIAGAGAFRLRVLRGNLDPAVGGPGHRDGIRRLIRPFPSGTDSEGLRLQPAEASPAHCPAGRRSHQGVAGPALRGTEEKAIAEGRSILWTAESGFYLLPALLRTWAPVARTLVIRRRLSYDHLSAISMTGELYVAAQEHSYHRSRAVREWLARGAARRIQLEQLPGYAPELNPDEGVWRCLKRVELGNVICANLEELTSQLWAVVRRLLDKPQVLQACVREVGYV